MTMKPEDIAVAAANSPISVNTRVETLFDDDVVLNKEDIAMIRDVILIGLASYGEVQKMLNMQQAYEVADREWPIPERVLDPTGDVATISKFADALRTIQFM